AISLSVRAGTKYLLHEVSLSFSEGQTVALVGPNGAGKSTLLRALAGELKSQAGCVHLRGRDLMSYAPRLLATHRAVLSQRNTIAFPFTVAEVVIMGIDYLRGVNTDMLIESTLAELDMIDLADRAITTLSGGEQQRVHFARVLVQSAWGQQHGGSGILLLDEPTAGIDLRHQLGMLGALRRRAKQGALVVAILHDLNLAALLAERIVVLDRGRIDSDGGLEETMTNEMLVRVFKIETSVSKPPASGTPFVLPQTMIAATPFSI
ncbi:MAG TPA: heme ABC transporter ATP-binding protein, partial [Xanthobacteraceae bacterium]|nr:heme ABC transporter ATP-binding protein [Xanthobacteraceae bacterium]